MPSPFATDMETNSQYSSCETLDSHRSSECDEKREVNGNQKTRKISAEHTDYIVKERVTRKEPPKPAYNPMQFVAIKPSNLYHTAQEQLKKAEEIKKVKDKELTNRKEDPEDWQNNLDNWKSSRRKRVEHIIDRIVEVKKLEEGEHDRNRRSIKTFSELMEERSGSRQHRKLSTLAIYTEEDDSTFDMNDLAQLSDENGSSDKMETNSDNNSDKEKQASDTTDDVFNNNNGSSNNNDGSNFHSTALIKDVIHKKQETKITKQQQQQQFVDDDEEEVKTEVEQRITTDLSGDMYKMSMSAKVTTQTSMSATKTTLRSLESRERDYTYDDAIEDYKTRVSQAAKLDLPKVDINKRRELFEQVQAQQQDESSNISTTAAKLGTEIVSIKDRISSLRSNLVTNGSAPNTTTPPKKVDMSVSTTLKDRLSSLHQQVSPPVDETSKRILDTPFKNVVETRNEFEKQQQQQMSVSHLSEVTPLVFAPPTIVSDNESLESDRDDSGIEHQQSMNYPQNAPDVKHESIITLDDSKEDDIDEESSDRIEEALDMAFQLIDNENVDILPNIPRHSQTMIVPTCVEFKANKNNSEPIYENVADDDERKENFSRQKQIDLEPHYQVPRSREPYYETPKKSAPIPLYENVELMFPASSDSSRFSMAESNESFGVDDGTEMVFPISTLVPPTEKPPPLPETLIDAETSQGQIDNFKRINSTKRIKKEIRNKRSSFLGIDGQDFDDNSFELTVPPPPNVREFLQEERRFERQLYQKAGLYENSANGESRDSGLDNHSRQSSEPSSTSSEGCTEIDGGGMLLSEQRGNFSSYNVNENDNRIKTLEEQISQQENYSNYRHHQHDDSFDDDHQEVLRVEQLLLQIEQQELKRQRENLILRKNLARRELDEGVKMLMTNNNTTVASTSLQDLNQTSTVNGSAQYEQNVSYRHIHNSHPQQQHQQHNHINEYRKSMPNLQDFNHTAWSHAGGLEYQTYEEATSSSQDYQFGNLAASSRSEMHLHAPTPYQPPTHLHRNSNGNIYGSNMTRNALMQISAVPKPKLTNDWIQYRKSEPVKPSLNSHWLLQEAEQRRIEQLNNVRKKPLPEAVIQTIQQRVIDLGIGSNVNKRYTVFDSKQMPQIPQPSSQAPLLMMSQPQTTNMSNMPANNVGSMMNNPMSIPQPSPHQMPMMQQPPPQAEILSVSSKKLCSYCNHELGSGAAMIIENLGLFYHIDCFKCSVCQTPISDGNINGTDVRVRNSRLHCANCFSNEEGIKFSCV